MNKRRPQAIQPWRSFFVLGVFVLVALLLVGRAVFLQHHLEEQLSKTGDEFQQREVYTPIYRGTITDRNDELLAASVPVYAVWANPAHFNYNDNSIDRLSKSLSLNTTKLRAKLEGKKNMQFVYVKRQVLPDKIDQLRKWKLDGVGFKRESRRYYPMGEAAAHLLGVTNTDAIGIEGIERAFDSYLQGSEGAKRVWQDRYGRVVYHELIKSSREGNDLRLSIDQRIQYRAHRLLKLAVHKHRAKSGSVVVLNPQNGEILAMASIPSFNPNNRNSYDPNKRRNRVVTDVFEPGSVIKPFVLGALLDKDLIDLEDKINTSPGYQRILGKEVRDIHNYGTLSVWDIIVKSSNIGISKLGLMMPQEDMWETLYRLGFGQISGTGFPGEAIGVLPHYSEWGKIDWVSMSHGYGLSVSPLQLAHAYTAIANDGWRPSVTLYKRDADELSKKTQVFEPDTARSLRAVLQDVVKRGTARQAKIDGFTTAGKTGTVRKYKNGSYSDDYLSAFVGFAPVTNPKLVAAIVIDSPNVSEFYGGKVPAPVFSDLIGDSLRILGIPEDDATPEAYDTKRYMLSRGKKN